MIGMIVRMDKSGLGIQTKRLARMMNPDRLMVIDSTRFNQSQQHPQWYEDYNSITIDGFPTNQEVVSFLKGLDTVISCELFYKDDFTQIAKTLGVKTVLIYNYEFFDWFRADFRYLLPDVLIQPSLWEYNNMNLTHTSIYLPTPLFDDEFKEVRERNMARSGRNYLFINGKTAVEDRNGLQTLYRALELSKGDFTITIKSQSDIPKHPDPRIIYDFSNPENVADLYDGYDLMILPRRFAGQALAMTEALYCGIPVVMNNRDPENKILPKEWLIDCEKTGELMTRILIDVYSGDPKHLAQKLDRGVTTLDKKLSWEIGKQFDSDYLVKRYEDLI
jgi:glycosyltransferase involved in cell wall biosynthesis